MADALIRAKANLNSFQVGEHKRQNPYPQARTFRPQKVSQTDQVTRRDEYPKSRMQTNDQQVKVNALPVNQSGKQIQCFDCRQWGHRRADCPNKRVKRQETRTPLPTQREAFASRHKN